MDILNTRDLELITKIVDHPKVKGMMWGYSGLKPGPAKTGPIYLTNAAGTGVLRIDPLNEITCMVHIAALPELWGRVEGFCKAAIHWGLEHTAYTKVIAVIPEYNRLAVRLCLRCGFTQEGLIKKSVLKGWSYYDQVLLGLTKTQFLKGVSKCQS